MTSPEVIPASVGDIVTVTVPNWASAGFRWTARFDDSELEAVERSSTAGDDTASAGDMRFRFRVLSAEAVLQLVLGRPGRSPRQTREFVIGANPAG